MQHYSAIKEWNSLDAEANTCDPTTWEVETEGSCIQRQSGLYIQTLSQKKKAKQNLKSQKRKRGKKTISFTGKWVELEIIMQSETNQTEKDKYCISSFICRI